MKQVVSYALLLAAVLGCINRGDAINRGMEWVNSHVPYNPSGSHNHYIEGCEGLVGDAWQFPTPGIPSWDLIPQGYCTSISKDQLQRGDILTCPTSMSFSSTVGSIREKHVTTALKMLVMWVVLADRFLGLTSEVPAVTLLAE